ncbi:DUF4148 domain-containing protein [Caenimonas koreensis]|uniref:DUF4148 domain-containing protein n=1 Tax=Caenimonas koreensis DSM 17982 TaxID=1121255 RepID=A0A844AWU6_9BURK|nr:DUF4148 domain-containing protein [Caenimonas koreensis]MRD48845.1 DUF4148 domain-containing protein [Caenimonas koreensis DSM 17982]
MNSKAILAVAAFAAIASAGVRADEADASQFALQFTSTRPVAEVKAEAIVEAKSHSTIPAASKVMEPMKTSTEVRTVRAQAIEAVRLGQIGYGEAGGL